MSNLLDLVKGKQMRADLPEMHPGDTVRVHARIVEGNKERVQVFEGVIIRLRRAQNASSITVRRISHGSIGVERTFLLHSPRIDRFEVVRRGKVRRAKLYYLRERQGKSARIKELRPSRQAGPVVAAVVVLPADPAIAGDLRGVRDSKAVPPPERERLAALIRDRALAATVGTAPAAMVDRAGLLPTTAHAMNEALASLAMMP